MSRLAGLNLLGEDGVIAPSSHWAYWGKPGRIVTPPHLYKKNRVASPVI